MKRTVGSSQGVVDSWSSVPGGCSTSASCPIKVVASDVCPRAESSFKSAVVDDWRRYCGWGCRWYCHRWNNRALRCHKCNIINCNVTTDASSTYGFKYNLCKQKRNRVLFSHKAIMRKVTVFACQCVTWYITPLVTGAWPLYHWFPKFPRSSQMAVSDWLPGPVLTRILSEPIVAPYMWYQNFTHLPCLVVGAKSSLRRRALSPCLRGADVSMYM